MIEVAGISKSFGDRTLWSGVSFGVEAEQVLALVGPSGCGKSTLLNCLGLLDEVDAGKIVVGGDDITRFGSARRRRFRRDQLGYLFQNYALIENATVAFNLKVAVGAGRNRRDRAESFDAALRRVGLEGFGREMVHRLSGGEQQRVALARLLVKNPSVILADEPTGALDPDNSQMVIDVLRHLAQQGCAVVVATHRKEIEACCDVTLTVEQPHETLS